MSIGKLGAIGAALALLLSALCIYTVDQRELAILVRLGEIKQLDITPGIHFQVPFIDSVKRFPAQLQSLDAEPDRFLTSEKKAVMVNYFVQWRIENISDFYRSTAGSVHKAGELLSMWVGNSLRAEFGKRTVQEVVAGQRGDVMNIVTQAARDQGRQLGINVVDVRTKRIDLPNEVSNAVYERMRAERERVAKDFRSRGAEGAEVIRATADREKTVVLAEAYREAEKVRGDGDAQAASIYSQAFTKNAEFYAFSRSLNAYKNSFGNNKDLILLDPNSEFFRYFKGVGGGRQNN
jgi:modulator of FtsH protease HflC